MNIIQTPLKDLVIIDPKAFSDERGFFLETFQVNRYQAALKLNISFVQDNLSRSKKNVLRGLHYQLQQPQDKLVTVISGSVFDVAVDIRKNSPTFGQWFSCILNDENHLQLFIPRGFAHGFCVLSHSADFHYKCSDYYDSSTERGILWSDPQLNIRWPIQNPLLSAKDRNYPCLNALTPEL
jgi:dTDP-4-dehydrorhamnose 3,5-epimerase